MGKTDMWQCISTFTKRMIKEVAPEALFYHLDYQGIGGHFLLGFKSNGFWVALHQKSLHEVKAML